MASPESFPQPDLRIQVVPPELDELLRAVTRELDAAELEAAVKSIKVTRKGTTGKTQQDLYSHLLEFANQGRLTVEDLTLLERFVGPTALKKEGIKDRIDKLKLSRQKETWTRNELKGRERDLQDIMRKLNGIKPILNLCGPGGLGKTTLGKEICHKWPGTHISVDLSGITKMENVYFHIMRALDTNITVMRYDEHPVIESLRNLLKEGRGNVLLLLDNVDKFAGEDGDDSKSMNKVFTGFLQRLLDNCCNEKAEGDEKQEEVKIVLISRGRFQIEGERKLNKRKAKGRSLKEAIQYKELDVLDTETSVEIFKSASGVTTFEDDEMVKMMELCKGNPLFLKVMAAILRQKIANAKTLLETVDKELAAAKPEDQSVSSAGEDKNQTAWDYRGEGIDKGQLSCLRKAFFLLPSDTLRDSAVALSLFCGPFSLEAAAFVLGDQASKAIHLLDDLRKRELLSAEGDGMGLLYDIHPLMRSFLGSLGDGPVFKQIYTKAKCRFADFYLTKIKEMAAKLDDDYILVFDQFDVDKANLELALDISCKANYLHVPDEYHESIMMYYLFEAMVDETQRRKIFQSWAEATVEDGREGSLFRAEMRCREALQVLNLEGWKSAMETVKLAEDSCKSISDDFKSSRGYRLVTSSYLFVEGEIYSRRRNIPRALRSLFSSLEIMEELLKTHTSTTRCLNTIGNCYNKLGDSEKALQYYTRAYEMRSELSGTKNHLDLPFFKGQIGTVYEAQQQFDKAISYYEEALELSKRLKRSGMLHLALFHRNIANAYAWQDEYEKAYKPAIVGYEIRKDVLGNHPDTARSAFQVGLVCAALEEFEEAEDFLAEAWGIEKSLGSANHSEVRDRIIKTYEGVLMGDRKKEFQREALEFYQHLWEDETEFSFANKTVIDEINERISKFGTRGMIKKYNSEALRFYQEAWNSPDLKELPRHEREGILQTILYLCKATRQRELHKEYQSEALEFYEQQLEGETSMTNQDRKDTLVRLQNLAETLGDKRRQEKYNKLIEELERQPFSLRSALSYFTTTKTKQTTNKEAATSSDIKESKTPSWRPSDGLVKEESAGGGALTKKTVKHQLQMREEGKRDDLKPTSIEKDSSTAEGKSGTIKTTETLSSHLPKEAEPQRPSYPQDEPPKSEGVPPSNKDSPLQTKTNIVSTVITSEGGVVTGEGVKLVCPAGAVDSPVYVTIALADPSKYCGLIVQNDLESDLMFCAPVINLQPNGHIFKKPVELTIKLETKNYPVHEVIILHGTEVKEEKIIWRDVTQKAKISEMRSELNIKTERFSDILALLRLTSIRTKDIVSRLNLWSFNCTMSVLFNEKPGSDEFEIALLFVSQDVYNEQFYREHEASALVQLKTEGFRELQVRSVDGQGEMRVYNREKLQVSLFLGDDYETRNPQHSQQRVAVESPVWWNSGHVIKLPLKSTKGDVRILCGNITVKAEFGCDWKRHFCELDLHGYVRSLLRVEEAIFNVMPIARSLQIPDELLDQVKKSWKSEDLQVTAVLEHALKENYVENLSALRQKLEDLEQDCRVTQRGQMHVKHLRYFATKISNLPHAYGSADMHKYLSDKVRSLCKLVLRDCSIEMERSPEGVERAASFENPIGYFEMQQRMSADVVRRCEQICSSSEECINETFLRLVPDLIQITKEIFVHEEVVEVQNGLRGLPDENLEQFVSDVRSAEQGNEVLKLICEVCKMLEMLCLQNRRGRTTKEIEKWGKSLAILSMLLFLKSFFQSCRRDTRLYKRLELFSGYIRDILSEPQDFADEVFIRDFCNLGQSLIHFAKSDPLKLVRFEFTQDPTKSYFSCEKLQYDEHEDTFYQVLHIKKELEDELLLHVVACVHINGQIRKMGAFQSVIMLAESGVERFDNCMTRFDSVALVKLKEEDSNRFRVVLCSSQREKLEEILQVLREELSEESFVDLVMSQVTPCHLTMRSVPSESAVLSLRLKYKWGSEVVDLDSNDFVAFVDSSAKGTRQPEMRITGLSIPLAQLAEKSCTAVLPASVAGNETLQSFTQLQKHLQIQHCDKFEVHFHQTVMQGHNCVLGDKATLNNHMSNQRALPEGASRSITDGKRSGKSAADKD